VKSLLYAKALQACLQEEDPYIWTKVKIKKRDKTTQVIQQTQNLPEQATQNLLKQETQNPSHQLNVQP
jgi:hypothetical protein